MSLLSIHDDVLLDTVSPPTGLSHVLSLPSQNAEVIYFLSAFFFFFHVLSSFRERPFDRLPWLS